MGYVNFNRALTRAQIEALGPDTTEAANGKIYFAKDGGIYVGNADGYAERKADFTPLLTKEYEPYTCTAADNNKGRIFFMNIVPMSDNYFQPWYVRYKLTITTTEDATQGSYDCMIGTQGTTCTYSCFNKFYSSSYYPSYYHLVMWHNSAAKYANRSTNPIKIGERIYSARSANTLARVYKIEVLECEGCTISFPDAIETYDQIYTDAKYGYITSINATSLGLQETGDSQYPNYYEYHYYNGFRLSSTDAPLYRYKFVGFDANMRVIPFNITNQTNTTIIDKTPCPLAFTVSNGMALYYNTTAITSTTAAIATGTLFTTRSDTGGELPYNFNEIIGTAATGTLHSNVYWAGDYDANTDQFLLDTSSSNSFYVLADNNDTLEDFNANFITGKYYWLIGHTCDTESVFNFLSYHPLYYFDGTKLVPVESKIVNDLDNQYVRLNPGTTEQTIKNTIPNMDRGALEIWRATSGGYPMIGFSTGVSRTPLGKLGFSITANEPIFRTTGNVDYKLWHAGNFNPANYVTDVDFVNNDLRVRHGGNAATYTIPFATVSSKLGSTTVGSASHPIYLNVGTPTAVPYLNSELIIEPNRASYTLTSMGYVDTLGANRFAFLPANQIIIEKTTDGGVTWVDAGVSDATKRWIFSGRYTSYISIPMKDGKRHPDCGVRVTFTAMKYNVPDGTSETDKYNYWNSSYVLSTERYASLGSMYIWINTPKGILCSWSIARGNDSDNWIPQFTDRLLTGNSGGNILYSPAGTFGGSTSQTSNYWNYRLTFMTAANDDGSAQPTAYNTILGICGYGPSGWLTPNNMMRAGHMYDWDVNQNVVFPNLVFASGFKIGPTGTQTGFLKADGSVDNNTYLKSADLASYLPLTGGTISGNLTINGSTTTKSIIPSTGSQYNLGASDSWWNIVYGKYIRTSHIVNADTDGDLYHDIEGTSSTTSYKIWDAHNFSPNNYLQKTDIAAWAKAANKPSYTLDEVNDGTSRKLSDYVTLTTAQTVSGVKDFSNGLKAKSLIIYGTTTASDTRFITSDATNNIYVSIAGVTALVITNSEIRRGLGAPANNLGTPTAPWNNVYGQTLWANGGDVYVGGTSGSRCHQKYDTATKCIKFIFD